MGRKKVETGEGRTSERQVEERGEVRCGGKKGEETEEGRSDEKERRDWMRTK